MPNLEHMPGCVEIKERAWYGVRVPKSVRVFDCRVADNVPNVKAPHGETLWGGERAQYVCGLKRDWLGEACTPLSCQAYRDFRTASDEECAEAITDMRREVNRMWRKYREAKKYPSTDGGGVVYPPVAIELCNFGWSIIADNRQGVVHRHPTIP